MIDKRRPLPITRQAQLLALSRASVYYEPVGTGEGDLALMAAMDDIHMQLPFYGSQKDHGTSSSTGASRWAEGT